MGKPIIVYSIEVALESKLFDEVMVSTDDKEIAQVAQQYGAKIPFMRSNVNADDFATTLDVVKEVLNAYKIQAKKFEKICILYPTAPLVTVERLCQGYEALKDSDACIPVIPFSYPVWRSFKIKDKHLKYQWPEYEKSRSQDLEPLYHDAGQWYWVRTSAIINAVELKNIAAKVLNPIEVQDIDTNDDWLLAIVKYKALREK